MSESKIVSVRIPSELLDAIDGLAASRYPSRRTDGEPNRSQLILDLLEAGVYDSYTVNSCNTELEDLIEKKLAKKLAPLKKQITELKAAIALAEPLAL